MKSIKIPYILVACSALCVSGIVNKAKADEPQVADPTAIEWLQRPWEYRYLMYLTRNWSNEQAWAAERMSDRETHADRLEWMPLFNVTSSFRVDQTSRGLGDAISVVVIEFDRDGRVVTPPNRGFTLVGRINKLQEIFLTPDNASKAPRFPFAYWFLGLGDISTHWAPGVCSTDATPSPFDYKRTGYLYGPKFNVTPASPTVGCREWAYQLYAPDRPYIDVTSYVPKHLDPNGPGAYIEEIIGWARFGDHKPVIGLHKTTWYCLHDCPGGSEPGIIPDITAWARKNGWRPPKPPTRLPVFPDPPAKSGTYP